MKKYGEGLRVLDLFEVSQKAGDFTYSQVCNMLVYQVLDLGLAPQQ
jgi:hypothetical protein